MDSHPELTESKWFKRFPEMTVCGESEFIKTFRALTNLLGEELD